MLMNSSSSTNETLGRELRLYPTYRLPPLCLNLSSSKTPGEPGHSDKAQTHGTSTHSPGPRSVLLGGPETARRGGYRPPFGRP